MKKDIEFWLGENGICLLEGWARNGLVDREIARKMGVSTKELVRLRAENKVIATSLSKGSEVVNLEVERALLNKALAGDVRACSYWLKNRMGATWGEGKKNEVVTVDEKDVDAEIEGLLDGAVDGRVIEE